MFLIFFNSLYSLLRPRTLARLYLMSFSACLTTCSTGNVGCSVRIDWTTLADGAGENPSIVSALTASSRTVVSTAGVPGLETAWSSSAMPLATILSFRSTMMRCAVRTPMPFTLFSIRSSPPAMMLQSSFGVIEERIIRAVLAPTPETVMSRR